MPCVQGHGYGPACLPLCCFDDKSDDHPPRSRQLLTPPYARMAEAETDAHTVSGVRVDERPHCVDHSAVRPVSGAVGDRVTVGRAKPQGGGA